MVEIHIATIFALLDGDQTRLQCWSTDGQPLTLLIDSEQREALLATLQRADRVDARLVRENAPLRKPQPPATRVDGWDV